MQNYLYIDKFKSLIKDISKSNSLNFKHPYIQNYYYIDLILKKNVFVKLQDYHTYGSLRDVINTNNVNRI